MLCVRTAFYFHTGENKRLSLYKIVVFSDLQMNVDISICTCLSKLEEYIKYEQFFLNNLVGVMTMSIIMYVFSFDGLNKKYLILLIIILIGIMLCKKNFFNSRHFIKDVVCKVSFKL